MAVILRLQLPIGHKRLVTNVDADAQLRIWNGADVMMRRDTPPRSRARCRRVLPIVFAQEI
jgi:hypothetical protein